MSDKYGAFMGFGGAGEVWRCFYSLRLDTYGKGCGHDCAYCYAKSSLDFRRMWNPKDPASASWEAIQRKLDAAFDGQSRGKVAEALRRGVPVRLGSMSDPLQPKEVSLGMTYRLLKYLRGHGHPVLIMTKSALIGDDRYIDALDPKRTYVQMSFSTLHNGHARLIEPMASSPTERLAAMERVADAGIYVAARYCPYMPSHPDGYWTGNPIPFPHEPPQVLALSSPEDVWRLAEAGAGTVIAGFLRLSPWSAKWLKDALAIDIRKMFSGKFERGQLHYSAAEKRHYFEALKHVCDQAGIRFSVCYDSDDHYETFRDLWADHEDCCDGRMNVEGFDARIELPSA